MKKGPQYTLTETDVVFGDALCKLYRFGTEESAKAKAAQVPILHTHPFYEGMLCARQPYRVIREEDTVWLSPGTLLLLSPKTPHCAAREGNTSPISFGLVLEKREGRGGIYQNICNCVDEIAGKEITLSKETLAHFESWCLIDDRSPSGFCEGCVLAYRFLYALFQDIGAVNDLPDKTRGEKQTTVNALLDTLLDDRRYTLKEISEALGYTRKHTLRLIHRYYGCDFRTIKRQKAIEAAKAYLSAEQNMTASEIAHALGYESESAFYVFFKKEMGCTPKEYQRSALARTEKKEKNNV